MRATRAYIASLGTTGLLLAFAASLLVVVGTLFAFNAWPGAQISDAVDSVIVDDDDDSFQVAGPEQVALDAAPAAIAVATAASGPSGAGAGDGSFGGDGTGGGGGLVPGPSGGFQQTGGGLDGGAVPGGGDTPTSSNDPIDTSRGTDPVADGTEQLTGNLGDTVGGVSPELGNTVTETGQALSDIVRDLPDVKLGQQGITVGD